MLDGSEKNQKIILKEQQKRMDKLMGKVDFIVTDAPLLLNTIYLNSPDKTAYTKEVLDRFNKYDNFCFVVERNTAVFEQEAEFKIWNSQSKKTMILPNCSKIIIYISKHTIMNL